MCNNGYHIVRTELLDESLHLRNLYAKLSSKHPGSAIVGASRFLKEDIIRHSVEIELIGLKGSERRREKRASERALYKAFDFANKNFKGELSNDYILGVGKIVDSQNWGYRTENRRLQGCWKLPPSWEKVEKEMDGFLFENSCIDEPLEKAIHAHLHIARIHPFLDGNGRTARLIQNAILERNGYVPVITLATERKKYVDLIGRAVIDYCDARARAEDSSEEAEFKLYLEKPNLSLREIGIFKGLALKLAMKRRAADVSEFYNYIAEKEVRQLRQMCDKILNGGKKLK